MAPLAARRLLILAGRPSMGKTALCLNIAQRAAVNEQAVVAVTPAPVDVRYEVDVRDAVVDFVRSWAGKTGLAIDQMLGLGEQGLERVRVPGAGDGDRGRNERHDDH